MPRDFVEGMTAVGDTVKDALLWTKNQSAGPGPGQGAPALGKDAAGNPNSVRYFRDGSIPERVTPTGTVQIKKFNE
jgi:hypothetical protein